MARSLTHAQPDLARWSSPSRLLLVEGQASWCLVLAPCLPAGLLALLLLLQYSLCCRCCHLSHLTLTLPHTKQRLNIGTSMIINFPHEMPNKQNSIAQHWVSTRIKKKKRKKEKTIFLYNANTGLTAEGRKSILHTL